MRVSENGMTRTVLNDLMTNRKRMSDLQEKLSSGYEINRPSDDPGGTATTMQLTSTLSDLDQFKSNSNRAQDWIAATESALNEATETAGRLRELAVQGASGSLTEDSYQGIAEEVEGLVDHLVSLGNTRHAGRYIFGGRKTDEAPFDADKILEADVEDLDVDDIFEGDEGSMIFEVGPGVELEVNVAGDEAFSDIIMTALEVNEALEAAEPEAVSEQLSEIDTAVDEILSTRARMGGRMNRLELSENRLDELDESVQGVLSNTRDADIAELVMHLATAERAYQTSLQAGSRILPQTLLDHLH